MPAASEATSRTTIPRQDEFVTFKARRPDGAATSRGGTPTNPDRSGRRNAAIVQSQFRARCKPTSTTTIKFNQPWISLQMRAQPKLSPITDVT